MKNYIIKCWYNLLVTLKLKAPFKTYKGKPVTEFKAGDFNSFLDQYIQILRKESSLSSSRRAFVVKAFESWLDENRIPKAVIKAEILGLDQNPEI